MTKIDIQQLALVTGGRKPKQAYKPPVDPASGTLLFTYSTPAHRNGWLLD